ncbi:SprT family zinc-dependent metalloprotease [Porifericola rhodea]|uniref:M48 family metallopeptidase n=1 Tax=Porifericola rhodea TaxID=930972 RepID=UPI00266539E4|nr:SprT family zinc-dependent metalloprotease [Porifericola rhodea]WKN29764.1 SprT family zinc-dependent metalloprotease [Porifericola rhodea]
MSDIKIERVFPFGSREINYELYYQDRKTLGIKVYPDCKVRVTAPKNTSDDQLLKKLKEKAPWIIKQQNEFLSYHPLTPPRQYVNGETHLYLGRRYKLKVEPSNNNEVKLYGGRLVVFKKDNYTVESLLNQWYRQKAKHIFQETLINVLPLFHHYQINEPELHIKNMPTRWGSCTPHGKVILNPELIKAPKGSIEYVIIHELCHLVHHNHTKVFYALQEKMMPDWKKWKERLEFILNS